MIKEDVLIFQLLPALTPSRQGPSHSSALLCILFLKNDQNRKNEAGMQGGRRVERERGQAGASVVGDPSLLTLLTTVACARPTGNYILPHTLFVKGVTAWFNV